MDRRFAASVLLMAMLGLVAACGRSAPQEVMPTAIASLPTSAPTPSAAVPPVGVAPRTTARDVCDQFIRDLKLPLSLTLSPAAPRGGETVRVTGAGLPPGEYRLSMPSTRTYGERAIFRDYHIGVVGADGLLEGVFVMPPISTSEGCLVAFASADNQRPSVAAAPFATSGNIASAPARCADLPNGVTPGDGVSATISTMYPAIGDTVEVRGAGITVVSDTKSVAAELNVYYADPSQRFELSGSGTWTASGDFTYRFVVTPRAELSGRCVEMHVIPNPVNGMGWRTGYVRFDYP